MGSAAEIIIKKRDGGELSSQEIRQFIMGLKDGSVADYQASAFLMAAFLKGLKLNETVALTQAMLESGEHYDLSHIDGPKVDKHSTGGIGDKVSLILAPLAAACGLKVPMMSGRGLGITGGTLDKLESIPGMRVQFSRNEFEKILKEVGVVMIGQSGSMTPADKKLYALRDVTGTVESIELIVASILSKKIAEGAEALVLDVKAGNGAFMKSRAAAKNLAKMLTKVARKLKLPARALVTNMDQPLGSAVGNALEVIESLEILKSQSYIDGDSNSSDLKELTLQLCAHMLVLGKLSRNLNEGRTLATAQLQNGRAYEVFEKMVAAQGGNLQQIRNPEQMALSQNRKIWKAKKSGYLTQMDSGQIGRLIIEMGGGRKRVEDKVDFGVGFVFHKKLGSSIKSGDPLVTAYLPEKPGQVNEAELESQFHKALRISRSRKPAPKLIMEALIQ